MLKLDDASVHAACWLIGRMTPIESGHDGLQLCLSVAFKIEHLAMLICNMYQCQLSLDLVRCCTHLANHFADTRINIMRHDAYAQ